LCVLIYGLLYALYLKHYIVGSDEFLMFLICKSLWIKSYNIHVKKNKGLVVQQSDMLMHCLHCWACKQLMTVFRDWTSEKSIVQK